MKFFRFPENQPYQFSLGELLKQQLFWLLLLRIVLYSLIMLVSLLLLDERFEAIVMPPSLLVLFTLIVYLATIVSAFTLMQSQGEYRRFGFIQTLFDAVFASMLVYLTGGSQSIFSSVYFFPIIAGGLLIPMKGGLIGASASTLLYALILGLEIFNYLPDYVLFSSSFHSLDVFNSSHQFATKGLTFFLAAFISALFGSMLRSTTKELSSTQLEFGRLSQLYKEIFDNIATGIITIDGSQVITSANNATVSITGLPFLDMVGRQLPEIFPEINVTSESFRNACDFKRLDNQKIRLGYALTSLNQSLDNDALEKPDPKENITIITLKDIGEIERLENQMRQAEKLAAIGMMSASIAHDFRNPLAAISGSAQILAEEFSDKTDTQDPNYQLTKIIVRESDRLANTITNFLRFARPENIDREWFQLAPCLKDILQVCRADQRWPATCEVTTKVEPNFRIKGDEKQLFSVISQLVQNAVPFCPKGTEHIEISGSYRKLSHNREIAEITISDNGKGVNPIEVNKIFEPFYTTRPNGTGLGLAIVKQTIEAHNGSISVKKSSMGGACFVLRLPHPDDDNTDEY